MRIASLCGLLVTILAACFTEPTRECSATAACGTQGGVPGVCVASPSSTRSWCAYEDSSCVGSELRWGVLAGDSLEGKCVTNLPDGGIGAYSVTIVKDGTGSGVVLSEPAGIACGSTCTASFAVGTVLTLTAEPGAGSSFVGWGGACSGSATCVLDVQADAEVIATFSPPGETLWARRIGGMGIDGGFARVAADKNGNLYVSGQFFEPITIDGTLLSPAGDLDFFIVKLSAADGSLIWARRYGGSEKDAISDLVVDLHGDVVASGFFENTTNLGGGPIMSIGGKDSFLAKFSQEDGVPIWAQRLGGSSTESLRDIVVDGVGDVIVAGSFTGSVDWGGGERTAAAGTESAVLAKFAGDDGAHRWDTVLPSTTEAKGVGVDLEPDGDAMLVGTFVGSVDAGDGMITGLMGTEIFLARYASETGSAKWTQALTGAGDQEAFALATDSAGYGWFVGTFSGTFDFAQTTHTASDLSKDVLLASVSDTEIAHFAAHYGGAGEDVAAAIEMATNGDAIMVGGFDGTIDFAGPTLTSSGADAFVVRLGSDGSLRWSRAFGGSQSDVATAVTLDTYGRIVVAGQFRSMALFGSEALTSAGEDDVFVVSLAP